MADGLFDCKIIGPFGLTVDSPCWAPYAVPDDAPNPSDSALRALVRSLRDAAGIFVIRRTIDAIAAAEFLPGAPEDRVIAVIRLAAAAGQINPRGRIPGVLPPILWDDWAHTMMTRGFAAARPLLGGQPPVVAPPFVYDDTNKAPSSPSRPKLPMFLLAAAIAVVMLRKGKR